MRSRYVTPRDARPVVPRSVRGVALTVAAICAVALSCGKKDESALGAVAPGSTDTNAVIPSAAERELAKLVGKWKRAELGYVLEIKRVDPSGTLDAAYFIPRQIRVARAAALYKYRTTSVFIELLDDNFPGCTYRLIYEPKTDQLLGQYHQAALKMTYNVKFARQE
jgi:hypothetical protein